jgi:hypothetical protein
MLLLLGSMTILRMPSLCADTLMKLERCRNPVCWCQMVRRGDCAGFSAGFQCVVRSHQPIYVPIVSSSLCRSTMARALETLRWTLACTALRHTATAHHHRIEGNQPLASKNCLSNPSSILSYSTE